MRGKVRLRADRLLAPEPAGAAAGPGPAHHADPRADALGNRAAGARLRLQPGERSERHRAHRRGMRPAEPDAQRDPDGGPRRPARGLVEPRGADRGGRPHGEPAPRAPSGHRHQPGLLRSHRAHRGEDGRARRPRGRRGSRDRQGTRDRLGRQQHDLPAHRARRAACKDQPPPHRRDDPGQLRLPAGVGPEAHGLPVHLRLCPAGRSPGVPREAHLPAGRNLCGRLRPEARV